jgi:hypothetical protein
LHWVLLPTKPHNRTLFFGSTLKHGRHFDYWNQHLNMRMCVCHLDYHETGLCCRLVIHIENLLCPLQLFYFHLWPIYWLSSITPLIPLKYSVFSLHTILTINRNYFSKRHYQTGICHGATVMFSV